jgi:hypothetical protein
VLQGFRIEPRNAGLLNIYRLFGLAALVRKGREDRGERRVVSAKLKEVIEGLALQKPPLPLAALFRHVQRLSKDLGEKAPSYGTVFSIVRNLGADLITLAHEGTKATATRLSWFTGEKLLGRMPSGRPITRHSTFC